MQTVRMGCGLFLLAGLCVVAGQSQETKSIVMTHVKYDALKQEVLKHRGKVVIVDFWATWCPNCMKKFPDFIELQKKHGDKGLVVIAVSLDDAEKKNAVDAANKFLNRQNSPFRNLLLDEPATLWEQKLGITFLPCYFVFDRQGKWVRFPPPGAKPEDAIEYGALERTALQMLSEK